MRILLTIPLLLLGACNVNNDAANDQVTVEYDQNRLENAASDVGNTAQDVGGIIANDVRATADKVQNTDVDVDVNTNTAGNAQ